VRLGGWVIFGSQVSLHVHYCKRDEVDFTALLWRNNGGQNGFISRMLFSELYKNMVNKITFVGFREGDRPNRPPWICPWFESLFLKLASNILNWKDNMQRLSQVLLTCVLLPLPLLPVTRTMGLSSTARTKSSFAFHIGSCFRFSRSTKYMEE